MDREPSFSPYAPIRYREEPWWIISRELGQQGFVQSDGRIAANLPQIISEELCNPMLQMAMKQAETDKEIHNSLGGFTSIVLDFRHTVPIAAQFELCGRQIFDLSDGLVEMLNQTELGDCTLERWNPPYDAFFVRFGKQENMSLQFDASGDEYLDGAFVAVTPTDDGRRRVRFLFSTVKANGQGVMLPGHYIDLTPDEQQLDIETAINHAHARRLADMRGTGFDPKIISWREQSANDSSELMKQAVVLLVNALFYLELGDATKAVPEPGRDTPPSALLKWSTATPKQRLKLRSHLTKDGYTVVRMMGREIEGTNHGGGSGSKAAHWRKGFWRDQHHGPNNSLLKRVLIKPVLVNAHKMPPEGVPGHIYKVDPGANDLAH